MKTYRLNRLFQSHSKKCFDVAIDHGFFNEHSFLKGIEDIRSAIHIIANAAPDAIQLTTGQAKYLQEIPGKEKPSLIMRTDIANIYGTTLPTTAFSKIINQAALQAVQADAVCVCINLFSVPGHPEVAAQCVDNIMSLKTECDHYGMPMMVEPLVFRPDNEKGGYMVNGDLSQILPLVRQAVELGADIIKADPCDDISQYHQVVRIAGNTPVLVRGGSKATDEEIVRRTKGLMDQGVAGIVYGRNIIQHHNPRLIIKVLMGIVHENKSVAESMEMFDLST